MVFTKIMNNHLYVSSGSATMGPKIRIGSNNEIICPNKIKKVTISLLDNRLTLMFAFFMRINFYNTYFFYFSSTELYLQMSHILEQENTFCYRGLYAWQFTCVEEQIKKFATVI